MKLAYLSEMHPDMIHKLLRHCCSDGNKDQQQNEDFKSAGCSLSLSSASTSSSSISSSSSPSLHSSSSPSQCHSESTLEEEPQQQQQQQQSANPSTDLADQRSSSTASIEPCSNEANITTAKSSIQGLSCDSFTETESNTQSFITSPMQHQPVKRPHDFLGPAAAASAPKQGGSFDKNKNHQPINIGLERSQDNQYQEQFNPTLAWTPTFLGMDVTFPKSFLDSVRDGCGNS